jgi:hypothetical protein
MYIVSAIEYPDTFHDIIELHYASSYANCINFIKQALADENSGVKNDTVITICECELDVYFGEIKFYEEKPASEYLNAK